ncbi:MAG TPA: hypothetical protein VLH10_25695, partial [Yinghuangia sp.]|nr:hypothetical protein [Yinghuangia sp.]
MPPEDDPSASGPDGQPPDQPAEPPRGSAGNEDAAWIPGQERTDEPAQGAVLPGQRTAYHRRSPFPAPRADDPPATESAATEQAAEPAADDPRADQPPGTQAPGAGAPDAPAPSAGPAPLRPHTDAGPVPEHQPAAGHGDGPSDAYLADRVRDGDEAAYEVLYARHVDAVRRLARLCTRTPENAEDLVA